MTLDKIFFGYMALVGIAIGAIVVAVPVVQDFVIKPYFWILAAVLLFDGGTFLRSNPPGTMISMQARLLGFVIGVVLMAVIPSLAGSPARFF